MSDSALVAWALPQLREILPLDDSELRQIAAYTATLSEPATLAHLTELLGDSPQAAHFAVSFNDQRALLPTTKSAATDAKNGDYPADEKPLAGEKVQMPDPPPYGGSSSVKQKTVSTSAVPAYAPPPGQPPRSQRPHTNRVIEAGNLRARDEQQMQQRLQTLQYQYGIYNSDIEPEHETDNYCTCPIHQYKRLKWGRYGVQRQWSEAVMYPGEKAYDDNSYGGGPQLFSRNPYTWRVGSPYGYNQSFTWRLQRPDPGYHARTVHQTIDLNNQLNQEAQAMINDQEPKHSIWDESDRLFNAALENLNISDEKRRSLVAPDPNNSEKVTPSRFASFRRSIGIKTSDERAIGKVEKTVGKGQALRESILMEEQGRWPDEQTRALVESYQQHMGMFNKIAELRARCPTQYLHLLRAGYFEPIPVAWATSMSNPLKFSIEAAAGWRGITPAWRGYEDTAEERLYWVLNHREGPTPSMRMKPDQISAMNMARERMARAVAPPPDYYSATDQCHVQHTSAGYSKQVLPPPFRPYDRPETAADDTMILLDVSGSMDFEPLRPVYNQYLVTGWQPSTQPKNKDVAKAIIRRFTDAMQNHAAAAAAGGADFSGYDLVTFANSARHLGTITHANLEQVWRSSVRLGGGTRVMTGWQTVKELHFRKHAASATHHERFGWQAGGGGGGAQQTPMLRLLLLLDGEAADMDEFELDLLGLDWAHVTIFLIGVDGCPHHHRHANELQRIADVNHHVSFVDAQGNFPERFVTHELLKRHLGYEISMSEFEGLEELPAYSAT